MTTRTAGFSQDDGTEEESAPIFLKILRRSFPWTKLRRSYLCTRKMPTKRNEAHDDMWEQLTDSVENTRKVLQSTLEDAVTSFEE